MTSKYSIESHDLTKKFGYLTEDDLITSGTLIQAVKSNEMI